MVGFDKLPLPEPAIATIRRDALVADLVTKPAMTRFLRLVEQGGRVIQQDLELAARQVGALGCVLRCLPYKTVFGRHTTTGCFWREVATGMGPVAMV